MSKSDEPCVSVIVPSYNAADELERALDSVLAQTMPDLEVLVVDDGSDDNTFEVARRVAARDRRVIVMRNERNVGVAATRNRATDAARGRWVAFLDSDDTWHPERLDHMLAVAEGADVISDDLRIVGEKGASDPRFVPQSLLRRRDFRLTTPRQLTVLEFVRHDLGLLKALVRRSLLQQNGITWNAQLHAASDFHFYFEILASGARWLQLPDAWYIYYERPGSLSRNALATSQSVIRSTEALLAHPAVAANAKLAAALEDRLRDWERNEAFATLWGLLRQRRRVEFARLLLMKPSYAWLSAQKVAAAIWTRAVWGMRRFRDQPR